MLRAVDTVAIELVLFVMHTIWGLGPALCAAMCLDSIVGASLTRVFQDVDVSM